MLFTIVLLVLLCVVGGIIAEDETRQIPDRADAAVPELISGFGVSQRGGWLICMGKAHWHAKPAGGPELPGADGACGRSIERGPTRPAF